MSRPMGVPKTGVFGLLDMIGIDLMPHVLASMAAALAEDDPFHAVFREPALIRKMIADGYTGRKGKGGFYRLRPDARRQDQGSDRSRDRRVPRRAAGAALKSVAKARKGGLRALLGTSRQGRRLCAAWVMLADPELRASLVPEISDDIVAVDEAMRLGYNWKCGPFELIDDTRH